MTQGHSFALKPRNNLSYISVIATKAHELFYLCPCALKTNCIVLPEMQRAHPDHKPLHNAGLSSCAAGAANSNPSSPANPTYVPPSISPLPSRPANQLTQPPHSTAFPPPAPNPSLPCPPLRRLPPPRHLLPQPAHDNDGPTTTCRAAGEMAP